MRFTIEQIFLTGSDGRPARERLEYHLVEAETVDDAVTRFLHESDATLLGSVQKFPGFHAVATARVGETTFTIQLTPGSDDFRLRARP